jgi:type IV pilus assembly protein PilC
MSGGAIKKSRSKKIPDKLLIGFTRNLATLMKARIPVVMALESVRDQHTHKGFVGMLNIIIQEVKKGKSLAVALQNYPSTFNLFYIHLIETGEQAGALPEVLERLTDFLEKRESLKQKIKKAMIYPVFVMVITALVLIFLLTIIVPTFAEMYADYEAALPKATQIVIYLSSLLLDNFIFILIGLIAIFFILRFFLKQRNGKKIVDYSLINMPIIGDFYKTSQVTQVSQTLGTLLKNGVGLLDSLTITKKTVANYYTNAAISEMIVSVGKGKSLASSVIGTGIFPPVFIQMITVGEQTAELSTMLLEAADSNQKELDSQLDILTSVLEPVLIVFIGLLVGLVIVSMYLPIFELMNVIQ